MLASYVYFCICYHLQTGNQFLGVIQHQVDDQRYLAERIAASLVQSRPVFDQRQRHHPRLGYHCPIMGNVV
jgi:hypothetical protein